MNKAKIAGIAYNVPDRVVTNHDLEDMMDTTDEWIQARSGIKERRWVEEGMPNSDMALPACQKAIKNAGIAPDDLDAIIVGTVSSDYNFPGMAPIIQQKLGITTNISAFDISAACSAFVYLLEIGNQFIQTGKYKNILLVGSDVMSCLLDKTPAGRATGVLLVMVQVQLSYNQQMMKVVFYLHILMQMVKGQRCYMQRRQVLCFIQTVLMQKS